MVVGIERDNVGYSYKRFGLVDIGLQGLRGIKRKKEEALIFIIPTVHGTPFCAFSKCTWFSFYYDWR
jgi:hypothetical protein